MRNDAFLRMASLLLLQAEFLDGDGDLLPSLEDDLPQFLGCRGDRDRAGALGYALVVGRGYDPGDMSVEQLDNRSRRAGRGANAEPAEAHEINAVFLQGRDLRRAFQPLRAGD